MAASDEDGVLMPHLTPHGKYSAINWHWQQEQNEDRRRRDLEAEEPETDESHE